VLKNERRGSETRGAFRKGISGLEIPAHLHSRDETRRRGMTSTWTAARVPRARERERERERKREATRGENVRHSRRI